MTADEAEEILETLLKNLERRNVDDIARAKKAVGILAEAARWSDAHRTAAEARLEECLRLTGELEATRREGEKES